MKTKCKNHPEKDSMGSCHSCKKFYCKDCLIVGPDHYYYCLLDYHIDYQNVKRINDKRFIKLLLELTLRKDVSEPAVNSLENIMVREANSIPVEYLIKIVKLKDIRYTEVERVTVWFGSTIDNEWDIHKDKFVDCSKVKLLAKAELVRRKSFLETTKDNIHNVTSPSFEDLEKIRNTKDIEFLINTLKNENEYVRSKAYFAFEELLNKIIDSKAVEPFINSLKNENEYIKISAVEALGKIGDIKAVESLINILKDENVQVRSSAVEALGKIGGTSIVEPIIHTLKDEYWLVRSYAAEALSIIGDIKAIEPLINLLEDECNLVRNSASEALIKFGDKAVKPLLNARAKEVLTKMRDTAIQPLINALKDENADVRSYSSEVLGEISDARAVEPLISALKDEESRVRVSAAKALGEIGDTRAVESLFNIYYKDKIVENTAETALEKIAPAEIKKIQEAKKKFFVSMYKEKYNIK